MSLSPELEKQLRELKERWDSLTPKQQAQYLRRKKAELARQIDELDDEATKPKQ